MAQRKRDRHGIQPVRVSSISYIVNGDAGLPYPLEPTIPDGPAGGTWESSYSGLQRDVLYLDHIGKEDDPYAALAYFDTLLLIDDSESMQECWGEVEEITMKIAPICTQYDQDGIDIEFVNHRAAGFYATGRSGYKHIGLMKGNLDMHDSVAGIYHNVKPKGKCRMDKRLASILDPYVTEYEKNLNQNGGRELTTPLNIIVISAFQWDGDEDKFGAITRAARKLDTLRAPKFQVGVQLFRVGKASRETVDTTVRFLDDKIWKERGVRDMVDMTTWTGSPGVLSPKGLLKVLLGGVRRSIDFMEV
ncbi:hypothetical protein NUW58_g2359 [Xylaria curta]|uniref:Uncharacterized protein n=1 Tax=Xylaria curta TaxID=42375 RepID=A0ACC1PIT1_9PEZI|nr:hypothetical protein NUW58_g2359 [Xylaria curta]